MPLSRVGLPRVDWRGNTVTFLTLRSVAVEYALNVHDFYLQGMDGIGGYLVVTSNKCNPTLRWSIH